MRDGFEDTTDRFALTYPLTEQPEAGGAVEVAPGVLWMRMPLGGPLGFINVWALKDGDGWTLVDTGLHTPETVDCWRKVFAGPLGGAPVKRVLVTHMHPDHAGMAGWITRKFHCRLWITRTEYLMCRILTADTGREAPEDGVEFYRAAGWDETELETYQTRFGGFGRVVYALPDSYQRIVDGQEILIGGRAWRVVVGSGHTPEHACFHCPELKLFISGDQVLPRITTNVSVFPTEPDGDPLDDWMTSLARIRGLVPDDVLVLPAHNNPFRPLHARIDHLLALHQESLTKLEAEIAEPKRAVDVFPALFKRKITGELLGMATGESLAHLHWLTAHGRAVRERDGAGVDWYRAKAA